MLILICDSCRRSSLEVPHTRPWDSWCLMTDKRERHTCPDCQDKPFKAVPPLERRQVAVAVASV